MSEQLAVRANGLRKSFGPQVAVDGLDLEVRQGEIYGLVGPDGAGKTTTMRLLTGILDGDGGDAAVAGRDVFRDPEGVKSHIGYMPQNFSLYGDLTVGENLRFFATLYQVPRRERIEREKRLLDFSRLEPFRNRLARDLSGGMKQKLALSCTLIHTPKVLFLDEPTTGVDPVSRREFWKILYALLNQGVTIFVSTPYMDEAERCSRVALINRGRIILCDTPAALKTRMRGRLFEILARPLQAARTLLRVQSGVLGVQVFGERLHVWVDDGGLIESGLSGLLTSRHIAVEDIRQTVPSLEDVFMSMIMDGVQGESD